VRNRPLFRRLAAAAALLLVCAGGAASERPTNSTRGVFARTVQPFILENCVGCHDAETKTGGLNLEAYETAASVLRDRDQWEQVLQKLSTGEMPPKDEDIPRPAAAEVRKVVRWLETEFNQADVRAPIDPGSVTLRRLNRAEYNNTVRDLLGVDLKPADAFPVDDSGYGLDNIGDVLSLPPLLMEKYLAAAETVARVAVFGVENVEPTLIRHQPPYRKKADGDVIRFAGPQSYTVSDYDVTGLALPMAIHVTHRFPADAEYLFRVTPEGRRPLGSEPVTVAVWIDGKILKAVDIDATDLEGQTREFRARVGSGEHWVAVSFLRQFEGLPATFGGRNPSKRPIPPPPEPSKRKPPDDATPEEIEAFNQRVEAAKKQKEPFDGFRVNFVEIGGPYDAQRGPSGDSVRKVLLCGHRSGKHHAGCERTILRGLARRAFRRPVSAQRLGPLLALMRKVHSETGSFDEGLAVGIQALLVAPEFLFRAETPRRSASSRPQLLGQYELASRLSYFLWSSLPDQALLRCADTGGLATPKILAAQVRRMLADPKAQALAENFGGQWLQFRGLDAVRPDRDRFPEFEDYLRLSMRRETALFFESVMREDRSMREFLDGKYTFLNERLAQFYKIPNVKGPEFRRVALTNPERAGVLTHASVLTVSSYANRTSPVLRGKWVLENILNAPPPDPPAGVPRLDERTIGVGASLRAQLEQHRSDITCAVCHARMDPLGFGLENYDAIGAWRTHDGQFSIDPSGSLPDGRSFHSPAEMKAILKGDGESFARCVTEKMLTYALGRGLERCDRRSVRQIAQRVVANDYRFSTLVQEIVKSPPFQMRRGGTPQ
jgi:mono/diheme cytochrome c family protein